MRNFVVLSVFFLLCTNAGFAIGKRRLRGAPRTEVELINAVVNCLQHKDTASYYNLFPPFDTLWHMVVHNADNSPESQKQLSNLREHPQTLIEFDPMYNHDIIGRFSAILRKGEDSGMLWSGCAIQRYELMKDDITNHSLAGYERIAPERFKGYIFVRDMFNRITFCITITEIQKIRGNFVGGQLMNILPATTRDEFYIKEAQERRYFAWLAANPVVDSSADLPKAGGKTDTARVAGKKNVLSVNQEDDDPTAVRREVVDRKYYEGLFDEEIPVKLYIRYMRDIANNKIISYDGLYKLGDQKSYVKLDIVKGADGKWTMEDDTPLGSMELLLKDKVFTGSWTNNETQAGYDAVLKQTGIQQRKLELLDEILDKGRSGKIDEASFDLPEEGGTSTDTSEDEKDKKTGKDATGNAKTTTDEKDGSKDGATKKESEKEKRKEERRKRRAQKNSENETN